MMVTDVILRNIEGDWLLITQPEHARLCGGLAERWGNKGFVRPAPWDDVLLATVEHDNGWQESDDLPKLNREGLPLHFLEVSFPETFDIFRCCIDTLFEQGHPYAAALVNRHFLNVAMNIRTLERMTPEDRPVIDAFLAELTEKEPRILEGIRGRPDYREALTAESLTRNGRFVTTLDDLALIVCCGWSERRRVLEVPTDHSYTELNVRLVDDLELLIAPWPFDSESLEFKVKGLRLPSNPFRDETDLRVALEQAPLIEVVFHFSPG
jgi:hypothetical protein